MIDLYIKNIFHCNWLFEKGLVTSSRPLLVFILMAISRDCFCKQRWNQLFLRFLITIFKNILVTKQDFTCVSCFGHVSKIAKGSGTSHWCTFSEIFLYKIFSYLIFYPLTKFEYQNLNISREIKHFVFWNSSCKVDDVVNFTI